MPFEGAIIPRDIEGFNTYINQTNNYLIVGSPSNAVRFSWSAADLSFWQDLMNEWNPMYLKYSNKKGSYTTVIKDDMLIIIDKAVAYDMEHKLILKVKATSGLTSTDCSTFRIPLKLSMPPTGMHIVEKVHDHNKTTSTIEQVFAILIPIGGGMVQVRVRPITTESGLPHKLQGYDLVEYAVGVFYYGVADIPTHAEDKRLTIMHSSRANFRLATDIFTSNLGPLPEGFTDLAKMAVFFFRWAKSKHPLLDGPWSGPFTTPLL